MDTPRFLTRELAEAVRSRFGTPAYVYDEAALLRQAEAVLRFPNAFGVTARFAMKANPNAAILRIFHRAGLHIDASSGYECARALRAGIEGARISLSSQEFPSDFEALRAAGVTFNACSLRQIEAFGALGPGTALGLRFNPGVGSGGTRKTNVGGPSSSFGIWHERLQEARETAARFGLRVFRIHTHIGSGSDPEVWQRVALMSLDLVREFPEVTALNLGGGYKVTRVPGEMETDLQLVGQPVREAFERFAKETGRRLHLEIEPGTFLVANAGALLCTIQDVTDTGGEGYRFLKLDAGMTEILRPSLYGSQHPIIPLPSAANGQREDCVVVGHCCESGDLLTPAADQPDLLEPRKMPAARAGDLCVIDGAGAYCAAMAAKNYNSFPEAPEVLVTRDGELRLIRRRQTLDQMLQNELAEG